MASQNDYHINQNWPPRGAVTAATVEEWGKQCECELMVMRGNEFWKPKEEMNFGSQKIIKPMR